MMSISDHGRTPVRTLVTVGAAATVCLLIAVPLWRHLRETPPAAVPPLRLAFAPPGETVVGAGPDYPFGLAAAPDGRRIAFPALTAGLNQLWLTDLTTGATDALPGTDGGVLPFWSPDGHTLAFFAGGRLHAFSFEDRSVRSLADAPTPRGGVWHANGDIIFAPATDGALVRRRAADGGLEAWSTLDATAAETSHRLPALANDGRRVVFFVRATEPAREGVWIAPFDQPQNRKRLAGTDGHAVAANEWLLFSSDGALMAQRLDPDALALAGNAVLIGMPVGRGPLNQLFATAVHDMVIFGAPSSSLRELRWVDRSGAPQGTVGEPMEAWDVRIAPIGNSVAVTRLDPQLGTLDIWTYEGGRPLPRRISPAIDADETPVWASNALQLAWASGRRTLTTRGAMAELADEPIRKFERPIHVSDWSTDRQWIIVSESRPGSREDIWLVPASGGDPRPYAQSPFNELHGVVSPDGRWLAYASDESGRYEIYVDSFPNPGRRARVTSGGGTEPRWDVNSRLYFRRGTEIHTVAVALAAAMPEALSSDRLFDAVGELRSYDVAPDGQRFLLNLPQTDAVAAPISVLVHWRSLLPSAP